MEQEFIKVNDISLASQIRNELKRLGIDPKYKDVLGFTKFTKQELASLKVLKLENNNYTDISALEYCTGLKDLIITSQNSKSASTMFTSEAYYSYKSKRANIQDFSVISKLKSLQFLTITDDDNLKSLDLTGLTELTSLTLTGNHRLTEIKGLETLTGLSELTMVNNAISHSFDLMTMVNNGLSQINLDFDLYPLIREKYPDIANEMVSKKSGYGVSCKWSENLSDLRFNTISILRMEEMDKKAKEILNTIIGPDYSDIEKISAIYTYIIQNVKYDHESLNAAKKGEQNEAMRKARENLGELTSTVLDRRQSSYNAILEGKSVCEGYTNMMHYLLKAAGINSMTVHCSADLNTSIVGRNSNHSVIKLEYDGQTYYFDPTWDAVKSEEKITLKNFFKTKDEFSSNHVLSMTEQEITSPTKKAFTNEELTEVLNKVLIDRTTGKNKADNERRQQQSMEEKKDVATLLSEANAELAQTREQYGQIATQIENLMKQNATTPIANYQQQLNALIQQRDTLSSKISEQMSTQKTYQTIVDYEKEEAHKAAIWQVEQLLGIRITNTAGMEVDPNRFGGVPQAIAKDTNVLSQELGNINQQLETLYYDGQLDLKTYQTMKKAVRDEYNKFSKEAPKPVKKEETPQHQQTQSSQTTTTSSTTTQQDKEDSFREKYGYSDMTEQEKMEFDEKLERQRQSQTRQPEKTKDDLVREKQEILRAGWKQKLDEMKKQGFEVPNLDDILRQQEIIEQQRMDTERLENTGRRMM